MGQFTQRERRTVLNDFYIVRFRGVGGGGGAGLGPVSTRSVVVSVTRGGDTDVLVHPDTRIPTVDG